MSYFIKYKPISYKGTHYKTSFELVNTPVYVANSLRRAMSSMIPTVTFDDTYYEDESSRSINIKTNSSALHNEFLSHRLSLVPISMELPGFLDITTNYNQSSGERQFQFKDRSNLVTFSLKKKNNKELAKDRDKLGLVSVTSNDFIINTSREPVPNITEFFKPDVFTEEPIIINKLKQDISTDSNGEEIDIHCTPTISMGRFHSRNDATGTVTYEMKVDSSLVEDVFEKKKQYLNQERKMKGLPELDKEEIDQLEKTFMLLDKDRVIKQDQYGNPNSFIFSVESIGFLNPDKIINDAITMLIISIKDIQNSFTFNSTSKGYDFITNPKVNISELDSCNVNEGTIIKISNENHTIGNLITNILRNGYCNDGSLVDLPILKMASYHMHHPTIEEIDIIIIPNDDITRKDMISYINRLTLEKRSLEKKTDIELRTILSVVLFQKALNTSLSILLKLKLDFKDQTKKHNPTFEIIDDDDYFSKNINIQGSLISGHTQIDLKILDRIKETLYISKPRLVVPQEEDDYKSPDTPPYVASSDSPPFVLSKTPPPSPPVQSAAPPLAPPSTVDDTAITNKYEKTIGDVNVEITSEDEERIKRFLSGDKSKLPGDTDIISVRLNEKPHPSEEDKIIRIVLQINYTDGTIIKKKQTIKKIAKK